METTGTIGTAKATEAQELSKAELEIVKYHKKNSREEILKIASKMKDFDIDKFSYDESSKNKFNLDYFYFYDDKKYVSKKHLQDELDAEEKDPIYKKTKKYLKTVDIKEFYIAATKLDTKKLFNVKTIDYFYKNIYSKLPNVPKYLGDTEDFYIFEFIEGEIINPLSSNIKTIKTKILKNNKAIAKILKESNSHIGFVSHIENNYVIVNGTPTLIDNTLWSPNAIIITDIISNDGLELNTPSIFDIPNDFITDYYNSFIEHIGAPKELLELKKKNKILEMQNVFGNIEI